MYVIGYVVDWKEVTQRNAKGTLEDSLVEAFDNGERWTEGFEWGSDSHNLYCAAAEAWEAMRGSQDVDRDMDANAQAFMNALITSGRPCTDLGSKFESIAISVSPETATRLAQAVSRVDFKAYRKAYDAKCDEDMQEILGECSESGGIEQGFEEGFLPYVEMWVDAVKTAAKKKWGLIVYIA